MSEFWATLRSERRGVDRFRPGWRRRRAGRGRPVPSQVRPRRRGGRPYPVCYWTTSVASPVNTARRSWTTAASEPSTSSPLPLPRPATLGGESSRPMTGRSSPIKPMPLPASNAFESTVFMYRCRVETDERSKRDTSHSCPSPLDCLLTGMRGSTNFAQLSTVGQSVSDGDSVETSYSSCSWSSASDRTIPSTRSPSECNCPRLSGRSVEETYSASKVSPTRARPSSW